MPNRSRKRPRDPNQLAKLVVDLATGEKCDDDRQPEAGKNPAAVELDGEWEWDRAYWLRQFGFSRADERKGLAVLRLPFLIL